MASYWVEVRGGDAFDLLQALNTGHSGTLWTIDANSAQKAINRFTSCVLQSGAELPYHAIRSSCTITGPTSTPAITSASVSPVSPHNTLPARFQPSICITRANMLDHLPRIVLRER